MAPLLLVEPFGCRVSVVLCSAMTVAFLPLAGPMIIWLFCSKHHIFYKASVLPFQAVLAYCLAVVNNRKLSIKHNYEDSSIHFATWAFAWGQAVIERSDLTVKCTLTHSHTLHWCRLSQWLLGCSSFGNIWSFQRLWIFLKCSYSFKIVKWVSLVSCTRIMTEGVVCWIDCKVPRDKCLFSDITVGNN